MNLLSFNQKRKLQWARINKDVCGNLLRGMETVVVDACGSLTHGHESDKMSIRRLKCFLDMFDCMSPDFGGGFVNSSGRQRGFSPLKPIRWIPG